jgi:superfamily II DNA or RNA helicase
MAAATQRKAKRKKTTARRKSGANSSARKKKKRSASKPKRLSRTRKPEEMDLDAWQTALRQQYGAEQDFRYRNLGDDPIFSEFEVTNPESGRTYRVAIRGETLGANFCGCADFATNTLGTCKHVEFLLAKLRRKRGGRKALAEGYHPEFSEVYLNYGAERWVQFRPGVECPTALARLAAKYFDDEGRLTAEGFPGFDQFLKKAGKIDEELRVYDDALGYIAEVRDGEQRSEILAKAFPRGIRSAAWKSLLKLNLYDYQREGALFAARAGRSLLADDMGLGKTIQAIAATEIMAQQFGVERVLIICPSSLKHQWEQEIARFVDRTTEVIGGLQPARRELFASDTFYKIINYDTIHRDLELIDDWSPDLVILDEAQRIKNWETRAARSVKQIASPYCIVLTGTPLENRLEELVSLVQFVDKHRLGPTFRFLDRHQVREEDSGRVVGYRNLDEVGQTLEPILLRRRKDQVLEQLPERLEKRLYVPMTPQQMELHDENRETVAKIVHKWRRYHFLSESDQRRLMIAMQNMRMSCDSTYLLDQKTDFGHKISELELLLEDLYQESEVKAVIFSQWVRMHELVERRLVDRGWDRVLFHGGIPTPKRKGLIQRFRDEDDCRAFLSTDAGGVGLNLQHANVVINLDMPWNPAVLEQRIGRVHRLGQQRPVQVVNFVAQGTIEEGMLSLLGFKKSMFAGVLDGGEREVFLGKSRLKQFVESVEKATGSIGGGETEAAPANGKHRDADQPIAARPQQEKGDAPTPEPVDPLAGLLQHGLALLEQLASPAGQKQGDKRAISTPSSGLPAIQVERDAQGEPYVKLPVPKPELVQDVLAAVGKLIERWR